VAIIELGVVASGFFLRAYAGAVTSHIFVSTWFLVVISFGALFLVVGKRASELKKIGDRSTRQVLAEYTPEFMHSALTLSASVVVTGYCLWPLDTSLTGLSSSHNDFVPIRLSVVPVVSRSFSSCARPKPATATHPRNWYCITAPFNYSF